jgi:trigger factor
LSNPLIFAPLYGMKIDESKHLDLNVFSDMDLDNIGISAGLKAEDFVPLKEKSTLFTIKRISRTTPAELNKEFFGKVLGVSAEANTEEEFRAIAKGQLEEGLAQQESTRFSEAAREELLKINDFSMPDEFLKKWMLSEKTEKTEAAVIEQEYEKYQSFFRWEMIENKLQEMNPDIIPTAATVEHRAKIGIAEYAKAEGQELDIDLVYNNLKKEKEFMKKQFETLKEENLRNFLEIAVPHQHVHITATEYEAKFLQS